MHVTMVLAFNLKNTQGFIIIFYIINILFISYLKYYILKFVCLYIFFLGKSYNHIFSEI